MELIEKERLLAEYENIFGDVSDSAIAFRELLRYLPTVEERKHGHWIGKPIAGYGTVRCSVCKSKFTKNTGQWDYCPKCGAVMNEVI